MTRFASVPGARLAYEVAGAGDPPMVFVHGWCCDRSYFAPQITHFAASHTVAAVDLRGHGESDGPAPGPGAYDVAVLADDVLAVAAAAGLGEPVLVGHSLGALVGLVCAARPVTRAGRARQMCQTGRRFGHVPQASIRPYRDSDLDDLYRICLQTGDAGQDATSMFDDPRILGHVFAAPYALFEPSLAFIAEDEAGVGGYIVGALDSKAFEERLEADWWPALRDRYPAPPSELPPDQWTPDQRAAGWIHVPIKVPDSLAQDYPSHLHVNLVPRLQSHGLGRQLMNTLIRALRERGSAGLHFLVWPTNQRAVGFYQHLGFTMISAESPVIFAKDLRSAA